MTADANLSLDTFRQANRKFCLTCSLHKLLVRLPADEQAVIREAIADTTIEGSAIATILRERYQWTSTRQVITKHRRFGCDACGIPAA